MASITLGPVQFDGVGTEDHLQIRLVMRHTSNNREIFILPSWSPEMTELEYTEHVIEVINALEALGYNRPFLTRGGPAGQSVAYTP
ncbi:hypothetical protein ACFYOC_24155 [Nocardiopsis alba]|uniref:hypothetical protein n=1 Tax=Nocardiopsis alba TaxID=53437 RepID=UPI0036C16385